ncbi:MAG: hypothetical protein ABSE73_08440 [Planctomycetota bacterium]
MFQKIKAMEWNDWLHFMCWTSLIITFILTTWWMTLILWAYQWACWWGWVAYEEKRHPVETKAFFERMKRKALEERMRKQ